MLYFYKGVLSIYLFQIYSSLSAVIDVDLSNYSGVLKQCLFDGTPTVIACQLVPYIYKILWKAVLTFEDYPKIFKETNR